MDNSQKQSRTAPGEIRRVLILGHTGFIGGNLFNHFKAHSPAIEILGRDFPEVDLTRAEDAQKLGAVLDAATAIIVCAAIKKQLGDNLEAFSKNLQIALNLCRVLAQHPVKRIVFFSSAAVYGEDVHNTNISEATWPQPTSYYGLAKFTSEVLLRKTVAQTQSSSLVLLRPALVYGPGDQGGYGPTGFVKAALAREPITLWGDGLERREFIYVGDLVRIVHGLTFHEFDGVVNVVSGNSYTFVDTLKIVNGLAPLEKPPGSRPRTKNRADHGFDNSRLRALLPGLHFTPLAEGVRLTFEAMRCASA